MASSVLERRVVITGPYVVPSSLRALCPPMTGDPNSLLFSYFDKRKIIENYGRAIIMAGQ